MPQFFYFKQYSDEYWEKRRGVPTASEFGNIIMPKRAEYSTASMTYACQLVAERFDNYYGQQDEYVSAAMKNGTIMEPHVRRFYEFHRDAEVTEVGFCLTDDGRFGCSPDGLIGDDGGAEIKAPTPAIQVRYLADGVLPEKYKPQVHASLWITGRDWWDFLSYSPGLPELLIRVTPDEYTKKLAECAERFWDDYQALYAKIVAGRERAINDAIARQPVEESYF